MLYAYIKNIVTYIFPNKQRAMKSLWFVVFYFSVAVNGYSIYVQSEPTQQCCTTNPMINYHNITLPYSCSLDYIACGSDITYDYMVINNYFSVCQQPSTKCMKVLEQFMCVAFASWVTCAVWRPDDSFFDEHHCKSVCQPLYDYFNQVCADDLMLIANGSCKQLKNVIFDVDTVWPFFTLSDSSYNNICPVSISELHPTPTYCWQPDSSFYDQDFNSSDTTDTVSSNKANTTPRSLPIINLFLVYAWGGLFVKYVL